MPHVGINFMPNVDINFDDIEVDVEYISSSAGKKDADETLDLEAMMIKTEKNDDEAKAGLATTDKSAKGELQKPKEEPKDKKKKEPTVTVDITYKDIQVILAQFFNL